MPFMRIEVAGPKNWVVVDGPNRMEVIPCDFCGDLLDYDEFAEEYEGDDLDGDYLDAAFTEIADCCENTACYSIEQITGYSSRLSAPGYMDCTEWLGPFDSAGEARRAVVDDFELCPACEDYAGGPKSSDNPACNFYHS